MNEIDQRRRTLLGFSAAALGLSLLPSHAFAALTTPRPRILRFENLNTGEFLKTEFFDGSRYNKSELTRLNHMFRDHRNDQVKAIDPKLFDQIYILQMMMNLNKPIQLVSGYRSAATNNALRRKNSGVAKKSYHTRGQAMDFRVQGVQVSQIRKAALKMSAGGLGYYPKSNFIHIDTGPVRTW